MHQPLSKPRNFKTPPVNITSSQVILKKRDSSLKKLQMDMQGPIVLTLSKEGNLTLQNKQEYPA